ncbi:MAG: uroporphyrinogen-III synthase [Gemmatimonadaceae bacterium]
MTGGSLAGRRIVITREVDDAGAWARAVAALGAQPVLLPCIVHEPLEDRRAAAALRTALADSDWRLVFSARAAHCVAGLIGAELPPALE